MHHPPTEEVGLVSVILDVNIKRLETSLSQLSQASHGKLDTRSPEAVISFLIDNWYDVIEGHKVKNELDAFIQAFYDCDECAINSDLGEYVDVAADMPSIASGELFVNYKLKYDDARDVPYETNGEDPYEDLEMSAEEFLRDEFDAAPKPDGVEISYTYEVASV